MEITTVESKKTAEFFELLCSLKKGGLILPPQSDFSLIDYLKERGNLKHAATVMRKLDILIKKGYIRVFYSESRLARIEFLKDRWDPADHPKFLAIPQRERTFALLIDYRNLEKSLNVIASEDLRDFAWVESEILRVGKIRHAFIFIPHNYAMSARAPINQLTKIYHYTVILCPIEPAVTGARSGVKLKDTDSVDSRINFHARTMIDCCGITDVVVISGDADFHEVTKYAVRQQKRVTIMSAAEALSGRFNELMEADSLNILQLN